MAADPDDITRWIAATGVPAERLAERGWRVALPCERRGPVTVALLARERTLMAQAFLMRAPEVRREEVYRNLLRRNEDTLAWRFALDEDGDVILTARVPLEGLTAERVDELLGSALLLADESFETLVRLGFDVPEGTVFGPPPA